jgi:GxxExxY protein
MTACYIGSWRRRASCTRRLVLASSKVSTAGALGAELKASGFQVDRERAIKIWYGPFIVGKHRLDLVVDESVVIELKANRWIIPVHIAQVRSYLHASAYSFGLILNFGLTELQWERIERDVK